MNILAKQNTITSRHNNVKRWGLLIAVLVILSALNAYIYTSRSVEKGFPLDDAWIHQTYARNLGNRGEMAFIPGQPSTGSTSVGWTTLLAMGYMINIPPLIWANFLGSIFAIATALVAALLSMRYFGHFAGAFLVGVISLIEWHMAWAAVSGMEIGLFTFLTLLFFYFVRGKNSAIWIGIVVGASVLVRPEGFILALVYGLELLMIWRENKKQAFITFLIFSMIIVLVVSPLLVFNLTYGGKLFPGTVSAKYMQFGYPWSAAKTMQFLINIVRYFTLGPLMLLIPFVAVAIYAAFQKKKLHLLSLLVWFGGVIGLYAVALPAIYHHGRYFMPLIPIVIILGVEGLRISMSHLNQFRLFWSVYQIALLAMVIVLWVDQASTYALQISLLNDNHAQIANWINERTLPDTVIATHDIGILGYKTERNIVDLAGLITPEMIPLLSDQQQMARYCVNKNVDYLIVFADYYQELVSELNGQLVYVPEPGAQRLDALGAEPFVVFQVK